MTPLSRLSIALVLMVGGAIGGQTGWVKAQGPDAGHDPHLQEPRVTADSLEKRLEQAKGELEEVTRELEKSRSKEKSAAEPPKSPWSGIAGSAFPPLPGKNLPEPGDLVPVPTFSPDLGPILSTEPLPEVGIPDDPPPHEGAWFNLPVTVNSPDLLLVEILEALPGRPITGERLVRPDGTITLGWYGDVQVRGLTVPQAKTKIILHLRTFLDDEKLGLVGQNQDGDPIVISPQDSDRVFVDLAAYNSLVYHVLGDLNEPGRLPWTGRETVLDALTYAGFPTSTANDKDITLYRPARGDKAAKAFKIDYDAVRHGDRTANLQLFPGDRLEVGRVPLVKTTENFDRVAAPLNSWSTSILQLSFAVKNLDSVIEKAQLSPEQRKQVYDALLDFLVESSNRNADVAPDPEEMRSKLRKAIEPLLEPAQPAK